MIDLPTLTPQDPWQFPVDKQVLREHALADTSLDDDLRRSVMSAENFLASRHGVAIQRSAAQWFLPAFPLRLQFWYPPFQQLVAVTYRNEEDQPQTFDLTNFYVYRGSGKGSYMQLRDQSQAPVTFSRPDSVTIDYSVGWLNHTEVPPRVQQALALLATHYMEQRSDVITGTVPREIQWGVNSLMTSYRRGSISGELQTSVTFQSSQSHLALQLW